MSQVKEMGTIIKAPKSGNIESANSINMLLSNWSVLPKEVQQLILKKLPFIDLLRFKAVSASSLLLQTSYMSSPLLYSPAPQTPWLMLPSDQEDDTHSRCFFSLSEKKVYKLKNMFEGFHGWIRCVGSSYGWMIISDDKHHNPFLFNPFSGAKIELPSTENLIDPHRLQRIRNSNDHYTKEMKIRKAVLISSPSRTENFQVAMLYCVGRFAFYKHGATSWTDINLVENGRTLSYHDITYHDDKFYAFVGTNDGSRFEVWDFRFGNLFPIKVLVLELHLILPPAKSKSKSGVTLAMGNNIKCYPFIVESMGELLCVYMTTFWKASTKFYRVRVYKFVSHEKRWEGLQTLSGRSIFIAHRQIMILRARDFPECEENSIYFGDDGEFGLYKLQIHNDFLQVPPPLFQCGKSKNCPLPYWVVPSI